MTVHPDFKFIDAAVDIQAAELYTACRLSFGIATALPRRAYTSAIFQDLENEAVWSRVWVCVGSVQDIPDPGDLLPYTIGDHAIHVQRQKDGSLIGRFNKAQHGGCRSVPAQCRTGKKTKCSYTSCGHSRDRDVIPGTVLGDTASLMGQYLGGVPERLLPIKVRVESGLIFANIDPSPENAAELPSVSLDAAIEHRDHFWRETRANWKLAGAHLVNVARTDAAGGALNHVDASWSFPNLVIIRRPAAVAIVLLQPTAMDQVLWRLTFFAAGEAAAFEADRDILAGLIDRAAGRAEAAQSEAEMRTTDDVTETLRAAWSFNQSLIQNLTQRRVAYWNAPLVDATLMGRS